MLLYKKMALSFASIIVVLLLLEIGVRVSGWGPAPLTYEGKLSENVQGGRIECMNPAVSRFYFNQPTNPYPGCVFYSINNMKFRNSSPTNTVKNPDQKRIVFIGDSLTFGFGVLEEDTFIDRLGKTNTKIEMINAAQPGAGFREYTQILKNVLPLKPDEIVIGINLNDIIDFPTSLIIEKVSREYNWPLRQDSKLVEYVCYTLERRESSKENIRMMLSSYTPERLNGLKKFIEESKTLTEQNHSKLYVIVHPVFFDFKHYAFTKIHNDIDSVLRENRVPFHDFLNDFKEEKADELWITSNDQHPNEKAHEIYYNVLKEDLK